MKKAEIYSVTTRSGPGYAWKWRSTSDKTKCTTVFQLYYDCLENARQAGYEVELTHAQGMTAPGGSRSQLR